MQRMALIILALTLAACGKFSDDESVLRSADVNAPFYDASGGWVITTQSVVYNRGNCGFIDNPNPGNFGLVSVRQAGDNVSLAAGGVTYLGTVSRNVYALSAENFNNGWKENESFYFTLSASTQATGMHAWSMAYGAFACDGHNSFTAAKQ